MNLEDEKHRVVGTLTGMKSGRWAWGRKVDPSPTTLEFYTSILGDGVV